MACDIPSHPLRDIGRSMDLGLDEDTDLPTYGRAISGADQVAQRVRVRLALHQGDDPRDQTRGLPYARWLATVPVSVDAIVARIRREVRETVGVLSVSDWVGTLGTDNVLTISGRAVVVDNVQLQVTVTPTSPNEHTGYAGPSVAVQSIVLSGSS